MNYLFESRGLICSTAIKADEWDEERQGNSVTLSVSLRDIPIVWQAVVGRDMARQWNRYNCIDWKITLVSGPKAGQAFDNMCLASNVDEGRGVS